MEEDKSKDDPKSNRLMSTKWYEYLFSVLNLCIGLNNFIMFPSTVHHHRGGAFFVAYAVMLLLIGYPVTYLELIVGQFHRCSSLVFFRRCAPILQGFGWLTVVSAFTFLWSYQYSVARAFKFLISLARTRSEKMPWSTCDNPWNDDDCYQFYNEKCPDLHNAHIYYRKNCTNEVPMASPMDSAEHQYLRNMIHKVAPSHMSFSNFNWGMFYCLLILWLSVAFVQNRTGSKSTVLLYVPSLFVFLICSFLLIRALDLKGSISGLEELAVIEWSRLLYSDIWVDSLSLVVSSMSIGVGCHTVIASFAPPQRNTFTITSLAVLIDTGLGCIVTVTLYAILGYIKTSIGRESVYDIPLVPEGILLTHSTFPVMLQQVASNAWMWIFLYYTVLVVVGWKTCSIVLKSITVTLADVWNISTKSFKFDLMAVCLSVVMPVFGLLLCFDGGPLYIPMVQDIHKFVSGVVIAAEVLTVVEVYGLDVFYGDIHILMGRPNPKQWIRVYTWSFWRWRWRTAPAFALLFAASSFFRSFPSRQNDIMFYNFYDSIQFFLIFFILLLPFVVAVYTHLKTLRHMKKHEKRKYQFWSLFCRQKHLRSWGRIEQTMSSAEKKFAKNHLPEKEPEDLKGVWKCVYRSFFENVKMDGEPEQPIVKQLPVAPKTRKVRKVPEKKKRTSKKRKTETDMKNERANDNKKKTDDFDISLSFSNVRDDTEKLKQKKRKQLEEAKAAKKKKAEERKEDVSKSAKKSKGNTKSKETGRTSKTKKYKDRS